MIDIAGIRKDYKFKTLDISDVLIDPSQQFLVWFQEAIDAQVNEPNAMVLSTIKSNGRPSARVVLLKGAEKGQFSFFTNYESDKGKQLANSPFATLTFFWPELERQVRIEGKVEKLSPQESELYFLSRPRESRIGAYASAQSTIVPNRDYLEQLYLDKVKAFEGKEVGKPDYWGGYALIPDYFEFWQGRPSRMHDRIQYVQTPSGWTLNRLAP